MGTSGLRLRPAKGDLFFLGIVAYGGFTLAGIIVWTTGAYLAGLRESLNGVWAAFLVLLAVFFAYSRVGRYVMITRSGGISRAAILPAFWRMSSWGQVRSFERVIEDGKPIGLVLDTSRGRLRYSNLKTPDCVPQILELLAAARISERSPATR
jgi:hypothetical protein